MPDKYHSMPDRREFLATAASVGGAATVPPRVPAAHAPRVEAQSTIFYRQPDGNASLVRFLGYDVDAPGGRLRVYGRRRRLLGTAAMLRRGDVLYGELWLPAEGESRLSTLLEAPGLRGVIRNTHNVSPGHRWTLYVAAPIDPADLRNVLRALPPVRRAVQATLYQRVHATGNPVQDSEQLHFADHMPFLRSGMGASTLERHFGIPVSSAMYFADGQVPPATIRLALVNAGVRVVGVERAMGNPFEWWRSSSDEDPLVLAVPPGGTSSALGFTGARNEMVRRIEQWLGETALFLSPAYEPRGALVFHDGDIEQLSAVAAAAAEWNAMYAYPHIAFGQIDTLRTDIVEEHGRDIPVADSPFGQAARERVRVDPSSVVTQRETAATERALHMIATLAGTVRPTEPFLSTFAESIDASRAGTIVFNPSPFPRSDLVELADGSEQLVTDVPELGYAYFSHPPIPPEGWSAPEAGLEIDTALLRARLNPRTGAIASLTRVADGFELVRRDSAGLNALAGARLEKSDRIHLPKVAQRLVTVRRLRGGETSTVTITAYEHLPWIDIENVTDSTTVGEVTHSFFFQIDKPFVSWEVPAGHEEGQAPVENLTHLRWLRIEMGESGALFRGFDSPVASVSADGRVTTLGTRGRSRYRIGVERRFSGSTAPWRFGWQTEPMITAPVTGSGGGTLPRFGSILTIDRGGALTLALKPADDGRGLILYLQEILGTPRSVSVRAGLIGFGRARIVDFFEQDTDEELAFTDDAIRVPLSAWGVAAVRLQDVKLARG